MGLASSQARLLSITARLTSNEYESQQISNAKMRLATQSQEASEAYIGALNDVQYAFVSFNSDGESYNAPLTASLLYEYADNKNQYILTNQAGKVLLNNSDMSKFEKSANLEEFLGLYGITKKYKTDELQDCHDNIYGDKKYITYKQAWDNEVNRLSSEYSEKEWAIEKTTTQADYLSKLSDYKLAAENKMNGEDISNSELNKLQTDMETARDKFIKLVSYVSAKESKIIEKAENDPSSNEAKLYNNYKTYQEEMAKYQAELEKLGIEANEAFEYSDTTKAQWYTNLWYKINGPSTEKSGLNNYASFVAKDGIREFYEGVDLGNKIPDNDGKIVNSTVWISNALSKGLVNIEKAGYNGSKMKLQDPKDPFKFDLEGISWAGQIYSSVSEIVEKDNDKAVAQAEAEYQRKTAEINAKDEKYQRKLSLLDSEHHAIQTEYESVKSAMNKNIDRSFKAFQG